MNAVVADFEGIKPRGLSLAALNLKEVLACVARNVPQFVKLFIVSVGNDTAISNDNRRVFNQSLRQKRHQIWEVPQLFGSLSNPLMTLRGINTRKLSSKLGQRGQAIAKACEISWAR